MWQFAPTCSCPRPNSRWHFHCLVFPSFACISLSLTTLSASKSSSPLCLAFSLSLPPSLPSFLPTSRRLKTLSPQYELLSLVSLQYLSLTYTSRAQTLEHTEVWLCGYTPIKKDMLPLPLLQQVEGGECITGRRRQKKKKSPRPFNTVNAVSVHLLHLSASALSVQQIKAGKKRHEQLIKRRRFIFSHLEYTHTECECLLYNPEEGIHVGALK